MEGGSPIRLSSFHLPVDRLSATALTEWISCGEQFRLKRIVKVPERNRVDRFIGSVHHRTIEQNFRNKLESHSDMDWRTLEQTYDDQWARTISEDGEPEWEMPPTEAGELGLRVLRCFMDEVAPLVNPVAVEKWFELKIPGIPVPLVGSIDVESRGYIEEFKTSSRKEATAKPRWRFQGRIYQLSVAKPVAWYVTTKQVTARSYTPVDNPGLLMDPINPDVTVRLVVQAVEQLNDMYARYGPSTPWTTNGLLHEWMCKSGCSYGPVGPNPICPAWRKHDEAAA